MFRTLPVLLLFAAAAQARVDFARDIRPVLESRCWTCHGSQLQIHKLRLDRRADALRGGESGAPAIVPGKSTQSLLIRYVSGADPEVVMPPAGGRLTAAQIELLRAWIDEGADWPGEAPERAAEPGAAGRDHWAFQAPARSPVPAAKDRAWVRNPIDAFVLARLEARGWKPSPAASPRALLRRMYLDVIGLPPTIAEQEAYLQDLSTGGADRLADRLLAHPGYGERWGRHWLDLVRYAESNGYERDAAKPSAWRYRDWVIRSLNDDKPYDRFVLEQLAGDELPDASAETLVATGFHRLGPWDDEPADPKQDRFDQLDDVVSTTAQVFLGLTLGCARCHNHKFDPLTARDYYSMVAIFNGLERPRRGRAELDSPIGVRAEIDALLERDRRIEPLDKQIAALRAAFRTQFLQEGRSRLPIEAVQAFLTDPAKRTDDQRKLIRDHTAALEKEVEAALPDEVKAQVAPLERQIAELKRATPDLPRGYFLQERAPQPPPTHVLARGQASRPGLEVPPAFPAVLVASQPSFPAPGRTSLRRLTLARWIASRDNPLAARVIVNRVWQFHFGEGLVRTPSDFGRIGERPTHPELLDWLAHWFVDQGWSLKKLHRLILTSNTWRMSKQWNPAYGAEDPENRLLWRAPYRRLEVEAIRDSVLAASGRLNPQMFGPSVYLPIPAAALEGSSDPATIWKASPEPDASRRTIYAFVKRSMIVPMLEALDFCDTARSSARRMVTSVAPQALMLFNGEFVNHQARHLAERLRREAGPDPARQIDHAYRLALARPPSESERARLIAFLERESLEEMCRVIFNLNEFVYTD